MEYFLHKIVNNEGFAKSMLLLRLFYDAPATQKQKSNEIKKGIIFFQLLTTGWWYEIGSTRGEVSVPFVQP